MKILLTGANGFIGRYLLARLLRAGHDVVPAVRDPNQTDRLLPAPASIRIDLNRDTDPAIWSARLQGIDAVVNCAGILSGRPGQSIRAIHADAPKALFAACVKSGVRRVIQISAISARSDAPTAYASTKKEADDFLAETGLDWVIVRPSLVYAGGAYGGTALFRALAALPFAIPLTGKGDQLFQPIHVDDLAETILRLLDTPSIRRQIIDPVGPEQLPLRQLLIDLRRWLGFAPAPTLSIPLWMIRPVARLGDIVGGTINTTALRQLQYGNVGDVEGFARATGVYPRAWAAALRNEPSQPQDRWHARLYFLRPLLRLAIAATWIVSGFVGLFSPAALAQSLSLIGTGFTALVVWTTCLLDIAVGIAVLARRRRAAITLVQLVTVSAYTTVLTFLEPSLWSEPFGPLLKNIPFAIAILVLAAIEPER